MIEIHLKLRVGVVIPAHNEAEFITTVIHAARAVPEVDEILVVDDGSSDRTAEVAAKQGARPQLAERRTDLSRRGPSERHT